MSQTPGEKLIDKLDEAFQKGISKQLLADTLSVSLRTIDRWRKGLNHPVSGLMPNIVKAVDELIEKV